MTTAPIINPELSQPFLDGIYETLKTQYGVEPKFGPMFAKDKVLKKYPDISLVSTIGLGGPKVAGTFAAYFPEKTYLGLISKMLGEEFTELNSEIVDGAAEMLNMIYGFAKVRLNDLGYGFGLAIPVVMKGKDIELSINVKKSVGVVPVLTSVGNFIVEFYVD